MPIAVEDQAVKNNNNGKCLTTPWDFNWGNGQERRHWAEGLRGLEGEWVSTMSDI